MKSNRSVGPVKQQPLRIPVSTLTTEHLSAVEAFERWQREPPRPGTATDSTEDPGQPVKN